jgi:hypothetical protein
LVDFPNELMVGAKAGVIKIQKRASKRRIFYD